MWWRRIIVVLALGPVIALPLVLLAVLGYLDFFDLGACFAVTFVAAAILTFAVPAIRDLSNKRLMVLGLFSVIAFLAFSTLGIALGVKNYDRYEDGCWEAPYVAKRKICEGRQRWKILSRNYYYFTSGVPQAGACEEFKRAPKIQPKSCSNAAKYKQVPCHVLALKKATSCFSCKRIEGEHRQANGYGFGAKCKGVIAFSILNLDIDTAFKMYEEDKPTSLNSSTRQTASHR